MQSKKPPTYLCTTEESQSFADLHLQIQRATAEAETVTFSRVGGPILLKMGLTLLFLALSISKGMFNFPASLSIGQPQWPLCYLFLKYSLFKPWISMQYSTVSIQATNFLYKCLQCLMHSVIFRAEEMNSSSIILLPFNTTWAEKEHRAIHTIYLHEKIRPHGHHQSPCKSSAKSNTN